MKDNHPISDTVRSAPRQKMRAILTHDYVLGFLAFLSFLLAYHALIPTLPIYLATLGSSEREIGVLVGTTGVSGLVSRFLMGHVLLKHSEKAVITGSAALFALSFLALILFRPFWPFFVARFLQGFAAASLDTAAIAYAIRVTATEYRARAIGYFFMGPTLASVIAASSAVLTVNMYGFTVLLLACTGLSLCAFLISLKLQGRNEAKFAGVGVKADSRYFDPRILAPAVMGFLVFFSWGGVMAFFPLYSLRCGVTNPGLFFSTCAVMVILVRLLGGRVFDMDRKERIIPAAVLVSLVALVILSYATTLSMFIFVGLLWGVGLGFLAPILMAYALEYAGSSDGTAVATYQASMDLGFAVGPATMGLVVPLAGYRVVFLCLAFTCLVNIGYFQCYLRKKCMKRLA